MRWRSAASIDSAIVFARLSSASWIFGKASLLSTHIVNRNRTSVQIISPSPGETRKLPPSSFPRVGGEDEDAGYLTEDQLHLAGLEEEGDQAEDEGVEGDRLIAFFL